jgi:hypothetical protein
MPSPPADTSPAAWAAYNAVLERMSGAERVAIAVELSEAVREIRLAGIQDQFGVTRPEAVRRLILEEYGVDVSTEP